ELHLAGEEGMRGAGDIELHERVFLAVGPLDGFVGLNGGASQKREVGGRIREYDFAIIRMDILLHERTWQGIISWSILESPLECDKMGRIMPTLIDWLCSRHGTTRHIWGLCATGMSLS